MPNKIASVPPRQVVITDPANRVVPVWHRFFISVEKAVNKSNEYENVSSVGTSGDSDAVDELKGMILSDYQQTVSIPHEGNGTIQYNNQGSMWSDIKLLWDKATGVLKTLGGRIHSEKRIINTDSPYTLLTTDEVVFANTDAGDITINIPVGVNGTCYEWYNVGSSGNTLSVSPDSEDYLLGGGEGATATFEDGEGAIVKYNSTGEWW